MNLEAARQRLQELVGKPKFEVMLGVCAVFTELVQPSGLYPVIVGGLAVEIYTRSEYSTSDIDLIFSRRDLANEILLKLGFTKAGRHWFHDQLGVSIEIPNDMLDLADEDKVIKLRLPHNGHVYVIGIEDIILDRLRACIHWTSTSDCEWGNRLFLLHRNKLNLDYMLDKAREDGTEQRLRQWLEESPAH